MAPFNSPIATALTVHHDTVIKQLCQTAAPLRTSHHWLVTCAILTSYQTFEGGYYNYFLLSKTISGMPAVITNKEASRNTI